MNQYNELVEDIINVGIEVVNERTGSKCKTLLNQVLVYKPDIFPIIYERQINWQGAIKELLCYIRGYSTLSEFKDMGVNTWDANYNSSSWNLNENYSKDSLGKIYGASIPDGFKFEDLIQSIKQNPYDRGHIYSFWNPESFKEACLRPCQMMYQFNVIEDTLHTTVYSRSCDVMLGGAWNMIQAWFMNQIVARLTGFRPGNTTHIIANAHIYENQYKGAVEFLNRIHDCSIDIKPEFIFKKDLTLQSILATITNDNFNEYFHLDGYCYISPQIKFPLTA